MLTPSVWIEDGVGVKGQFIDDFNKPLLCAWQWSQMIQVVLTHLIIRHQNDCLPLTYPFLLQRKTRRACRCGSSKLILKPTVALSMQRVSDQTAIKPLFFKRCWARIRALEIYCLIFWHQQNKSAARGKENNFWQSAETWSPYLCKLGGNSFCEEETPQTLGIIYPKQTDWSFSPTSASLVTLEKCSQFLLSPSVGLFSLEPKKQCKQNNKIIIN